MFSKHPKGLIAAALANMGERFGFYIMMAILTLFIFSEIWIVRDNYRIHLFRVLCFHLYFSFGGRCYC